MALYTLTGESRLNTVNALKSNFQMLLFFINN